MREKYCCNRIDLSDDEMNMSKVIKNPTVFNKIKK